MEEEMESLPLLPLRDITVLPTMVQNFDVSPEKSVKAVEAAMAADQKIFLVTLKDPDEKNPGLQNLYEIGVTARILHVARLPREQLRVRAEGIDKARLIALKDGDFLRADLELLSERPTEIDGITREAMVRSLDDLLVRYAGANQKFSRDMLRQLLEVRDFDKLTCAACVQIPLPYEDRQRLLEASGMEARYHELSSLLVREIEVMEVRSEIEQKVRERVDKNQREYVLREEVRVIQEELGEDPLLGDVRKYEEEARKLEASDEVKDKIVKEAERLKTIGANSAESSVIRTYIETLLSLPWDKASEDHTDLKEARRILDEDHYGLDEVKERVLEFLAVRALTQKGESPILCLVGPPGTGKTSIARSVARALGKEYVRISLGGVHDEAEIRGHRRTYIGAMPGRIAEAIRHAGVRNPVMLLDEVDKLSSDYRGDAASALLEVLDGEQNCRFCDHYVELPMDLSEVLFITTANDLQSVPAALLDRMEVIELSSYTENEKLHIAKEHLLPKQIRRNGLKKSQLSVTDAAVNEIIRCYTREAGVRQLERELGQICRRAAREVMEEGTAKVHVSGRNIKDYLGEKKNSVLKKNDRDDVGIVRGLAWTSAGGDTLQIEVNTMPGNGQLILTGQLGDVMKESAQTAVSYVRSVADSYQIDPEFFSKNDIHIHIPEGAVPKDGPSAGITIATAILSAVTGIPVRADVAMTGEITLRGKVLPIGGLKEKLIAAKQAGISTVLVPSRNREDVSRIQEEVTDGLQLIYADAMPEVLKEALV